MSTPLLIVFLVWLSLLTVVLVLVMRQIGLLVLSLKQNPRRDAVADGLAPGEPVPTNVSEYISTGARRHVLFLSLKCAPCQELVSGLHRLEDIDCISVVAVGEDLAKADAALELPAEVDVVRGPAAESVRAAFAVNTFPFAFTVESDYVEAKAVLRGIEDLIEFVQVPEVVRVVQHG